MSRVCQITNKGPMSGNARSHSMHSTRRKWGVNLQKATINIDGVPTKVKVSTRALKTLKRKGKLA